MKLLPTITFRKLFFIFMFATITTFTACSDSGGGGGGDASTDVVVTGVTLNKNTVTLVVNASETLTALVSPANATNKAVTWSSSNETIATVSDTGEVRGVGKGTATITVTTEDGNETDTCEVTVANFVEVEYNDLETWIRNTAVPNAVNHVKVMNVPASAFEGYSSAWRIKIDNNDGKKFFLKIGSVQGTLTSIGERAFYGVFELTGLDISACTDVTLIGREAFRGCNPLRTIELPGNLQTIGRSAFRECGSLTTIELPGNLQTIGIMAFKYCGSLTTIELPGNLQTIGNMAFALCDSLTTIELPANLETIWYDAFFACSSLTSINVHSNNKNYSSQNGILFNKAGTTLILCPEGKSGEISIPDTVESIGSHALAGCSSLTSMELPVGVSQIHDSAFWGCTNLIITLPTTITNIDDRAFGGGDIFYCAGVIVPNDTIKNLVTGSPCSFPADRVVVQP